MRRFLYVYHKPTLAQFASIYLIVNFKNAKLVVDKYNSSIDFSSGDEFYLIGRENKISSYNNSKIKFKFGIPDELVHYVNHDALLFDQTLSFVFNEKDENYEKNIFASNFLRKVVFNNASEYSLLRLYFYYHSENSQNLQEFCESFLKEVDKVFKIGVLMYKSLQEFKSLSINRIVTRGGGSYAIYWGKNDPFLYRYLFDTVDVIVYYNPFKKRLGLLLNKRTDRNFTEKVINEFMKEFKGYKVKRLDYTVFVTTDDWQREIEKLSLLVENIFEKNSLQ